MSHRVNTLSMKGFLCRNFYKLRKKRQYFAPLIQRSHGRFLHLVWTKGQLQRARVSRGSDIFSLTVWSPHTNRITGVNHRYNLKSNESAVEC
jgi:hypothetical protein